MRRICIALVLAGLVLQVGAAGCAAPSEPAPAAPVAPPPDRSRALPGYYVADTAAGPRLYREFHRVATDDPGSAAVQEMLRGPVDPDYGTPWPAGTALRTPVARAGGMITVDLTVPGTASMGTAAAELSVQQLVYTVQAALGATDPVRLLVDGAPVPELFGAVATAEPIRRADQYAVRSLVQIDVPADGAEVGRTVTVTGEAAVFEATVPWEVLRDGVVVRRGSATSAEGQRFAPYSFELTLEPGTYVVRVTEDDPSGGEGRPPFVDTKTVTVR